VELMARSLRTASNYCNYFGRCVRNVKDLHEGEFIPAVRRWLAENP
jgi:hypothetical protein